MSDDLRDGSGGIESGVSGSADDVRLTPGDEVSSKLAVLQAIEESLSKSSSKLGELLSLITSGPAPWLSEMDRYGASADVDGAQSTTQIDSRVDSWVEPDPAAPFGLGRIMLSWPAGERPDAKAIGAAADVQTKLSGVLESHNPLVASNIASSSGTAANDNVVWVGDEDGDGIGGVYGREPC
jgi:hypothetical protein